MAHAKNGGIIEIGIDNPTSLAPKSGTSNLFWEVGQYKETWFIIKWTTPLRKIQGDLTLKVPQPFSLQKTICISLRNKEKLIFFLLFGNKIFSVKNWILNLNSVGCSLPVANLRALARFKELLFSTSVYDCSVVSVHIKISKLF